MNDVTLEAVRLNQQRSELTLNELRFIETGLRHKEKWLTKNEWAKLTGIIHWTILRILPRMVAMGLMEREQIGGPQATVFYCFSEKGLGKVDEVLAVYKRQIAVLRSREGMSL